MGTSSFYQFDDDSTGAVDTNPVFFTGHIRVIPSASAAMGNIALGISFFGPNTSAGQSVAANPGGIQTLVFGGVTPVSTVGPSTIVLLLPFVQLITAGEDQIAICTFSVTLTATIIGDLTGHFIVWEQISGSSVTFTTPTNLLTVMYTAVTSVDRVFRFYIDKTLPYEQSDAVTVFGTPTSLTYVNNAGSGGAGKIGQVLGEYGNVDPRERIPVVHALRFFPPTYNTTGQGGCTGTLWAISWTEPTQPQLLSRYIVQQLVGFTFVDVTDILPTQPRMYFTVVDQGVYRVVAEYNNALLVDDVGSILSTHPSQAVYLTTDPRIEGADIEGSSPSVAAGLAGSINNVNVISYVTTLLTVHACDNFTDIPDTNSGAFSNTANSVQVLSYSALSLTIHSCDNFTDIPDTNSGAFSNTANSVRIPSYSVLNLGGNSIGG